MEVFDLPGFCVLLAGIALYNVYEYVPAVKTRPGPYGSLCSEAFYINILLSLLSLCSLFENNENNSNNQMLKQSRIRIQS